MMLKPRPVASGRCNTTTRCVVLEVYGNNILLILHMLTHIHTICINATVIILVHIIQHTSCFDNAHPLILTASVLHHNAHPPHWHAIVYYVCVTLLRHRHLISHACDKYGWVSHIYYLWWSRHRLYNIIQQHNHAYLFLFVIWRADQAGCPNGILFNFQHSSGSYWSQNPYCIFMRNANHAVSIYLHTDMQKQNSSPRIQMYFIYLPIHICNFLWSIP